MTEEEIWIYSNTYLHEIESYIGTANNINSLIKFSSVDWFPSLILMSGFCGKQPYVNLACIWSTKHICHHNHVCILPQSPHESLFRIYTEQLYSFPYTHFQFLNICITTATFDKGVTFIFYQYTLQVTRSCITGSVPYLLA